MTSVVDSLLATYPLISDQMDTDEMRVMLSQLETTIQKGVNGSVVEFGCYLGTSSLFIRRLLDSYQSSAAFHVYDSFLGLPEKLPQDSSPAGEQFKAGELAASKKAFQMQFKKAQLAPPIIHKSWFHELHPHDLPDQICFAFLDGDYFESVLTPLTLIWHKLDAHAVVIVDDYANEALPGARRAVDAWLVDHPARLTTQSSLAIITKM